MAGMSGVLSWIAAEVRRLRKEVGAKKKAKEIEREKERDIVEKEKERQESPRSKLSYVLGYKQTYEPGEDLERLELMPAATRRANADPA